MSETRIRLQVMREVAEQADLFYPQAEALGKLAAEKITSRHRKQITDLEGVADTAMKVADILNHIKLQTARRDYWRELGPKLLEVVQTDLKQRRHTICAKLALADEHDRAKQEQQVHLHLIREFVRQLAAHYEYQCMVTERGG